MNIKIKEIITAIMILTLIFTLPLAAFGESGTVSEAGAKKIDVAGALVTIYDDGRIKGIEQPEKISKVQQNEILKLMGFTEEEINQFSQELINELLIDGGIKVDVKIEDFVHIYTDLEGNDHIVTDDNRKEIDELRKNDYESIQKILGSEDILLSSSWGKEDGIFTGGAIVTYVGTTSNGQEYRYKYRTTFNWSRVPVNTYTDSIGQAWQSHTISTSTSGNYTREFNGGYTSFGIKDIDSTNVYGSQAKIDLRNLNGRHYGYLEDEVRIPIRYRGDTGQFASSYAHPWTPVGISLSIREVKIDFGNAIGDKWGWKNTFEYIGDRNPREIEG